MNKKCTLSPEVTARDKIYWQEGCWRHTPTLIPFLAGWTCCPWTCLPEALFASKPFLAAISRSSPPSLRVLVHVLSCSHVSVPRFWQCQGSWAAPPSLPYPPPSSLCKPSPCPAPLPSPARGATVSQGSCFITHFNLFTCPPVSLFSLPCALPEPGAAHGLSGWVQRGAPRFVQVISEPHMFLDISASSDDIQ